jgi:putative membrane-bound dehydrogenase-like protein
MRFLIAFLTIAFTSTLLAADGNRLTYLDSPCDPYYVHREFPKLVTPQWVGEEGVDAVVVLAIDDMRDTAKYEIYLRPILDRLKKIDGRAPVSIMTCSANPADAQLQTWLKEGLSIEVHTYDHPCPCLQNGDFKQADKTYTRCVDLLAKIPNNKPVAFRMPCCDSRNTPSPRFWQEIFNNVSPDGNFLQADSSVFNIITENDKELPAAIRLNEKGESRFRRYLPFPSFVNTIEDYPYPYIIGGRCWQFPCVVPSDWEAQHVQQPNNPDTIRDMKLALDATVIKKGVYNLVFHPHGWMRNDQVIELIDHAVTKYGKRVKFLTFREAVDRINKNLLDDHPLRTSTGAASLTRVLDINNDGYLDVMTPGDTSRTVTRIWQPKQNRWFRSEQNMGLENAKFGVVRKDGRASVFVEHNSLFEFNTTGWQLQNTSRLPKLTEHNHIRFRDIDGDGICEILAQNTDEVAAFAFRQNQIGIREVELIGMPFREGVSLVTNDKDAKDLGLRFFDVNRDGHDDIVFSNYKQFGIYLYSKDGRGWTETLVEGKRTDKGALPMIVGPDGTNNGAWFHSGKMWVQNETTNRLADGVDRVDFEPLLKARAERIPKPRSPEEALRTFKLPPGMRIELIAAEPLIADPVAFDWGPDGRLWVVEMADYPNGMEYRVPGDKIGVPGGRVKVLDDVDGDGKYDKATLFLDKLPFPTGIKVWRDGVIVSTAPDVFFAKDTDGDDIADERKTLFSGFGQGNQQHRVNGLRWGLDNWLYLANGDSGGRVTYGNGQSIDISGRDLRLRPDGLQLELVSGQTQSGRNRDDWGNWFGGNNSNPMWHYLLRDQYLKRNQHLASPNTRKAVSQQPGAAPVFPTSLTTERFNDQAKANRFTSACSPIVYRDSLLLAPQMSQEDRKRFSGQTFVCEPVHNLVHREILLKDGISFTSKRADSELKSEFLTSTDNWFRPVMVRTGPTGGLWIADMYRQVIEHPEWIPADAQRKYDLRAGDKRGRIYRVVTEPKLPTALNLSELPTERLVTTLAARNGWVRDTAQQMLIWKKDVSVVPQLILLAQNDISAKARLHAICTLDGLRVLDKPNVKAVILAAISDKHPGVRANAIRIAEQIAEDKEIAAKIVSRVEIETDPLVKLQLAYTLGELHGPTAAKGIAILLTQHAGDRNMMAAIESSLRADNIVDVIKSFKPGILRTQLQIQLTRFAAATKQFEALTVVAKQLVDQSKGRDLTTTEMKLLATILNSPHSAAIAASLPEKTQQDLQAAQERVLEIALDSKAPLSQRISAIATAGNRSKSGFSKLRRLLAAQHPIEIQLAVLNRLAELDQDEEIFELLIELLGDTDHYSPQLRSQIIDQVVQRKSWQNAAIQAGVLESLYKSTDIKRRGLLENIPQLAEHLNSKIARSSRADIISEYLRRIATEGKPELGKPIFVKHCAACHKFRGDGSPVGPDLAALSNKTRANLLVALLDPSRAVEAKYLEFTVSLANGKQHTGMIASESTNSIAFVGQNAKTTTVLRRDIEQISTQSKSFMPEGIEKVISAENMDHLIAYIRTVVVPNKKFPGNDPKLVVADENGVLQLASTRTSIYGPTIVFEPGYKNLGFWGNIDDRAVWDLKIPKPGKYSVAIDYACNPDTAGNTVQISINGLELDHKIESSGSWDNYRQAKIGTIELPAGTFQLSAQAAQPLKGYLMDLKEITLTPEIAE